MTIQTRMPPRSRIAADGLPRRLFTVADVERMIEVGILDEKERVELIEGELVPMAPQGNRHELVKSALLEVLHARRSADLRFAVETTLRLSDGTFLVPDEVTLSRRLGFQGLEGGTALLVVEIAATSKSHDLGRKAALYAASGVRELWVIDAENLETHVHRDPSADGYATVTTHPPSRAIVPHLAPALVLRMDDLDLAGA